MPETRESIVKLEETGVLHIAEDVVVSIAAIAAAEVEGVASLSSPDLLGKKAHGRGVKISMDGEQMSIDISLLVRYGHPVMTVAQNVQQKVGGAVATMTGLKPGAINVHVVGIAFDKDEKNMKK